MKLLQLFAVCITLALVDAKPPNIVFIVADDLGWNDIGFHNPEILSPNIDKLAHEGVILNQSYVQPACSPSRGAFLTGMYPYKMGLQHIVMGGVQPVCTPLKYSMLPQMLKDDLGYATHAVGKWHQGFCKLECIPTWRGFDSFLGYYNSEEDYYTHEIGGYLDLHDGELPVRNKTGVYSAYMFADRAIDIISKHNASQPLFMYLPFQSVHRPIQVPKKYTDLYPHIASDMRRGFAGMVSALDDAIGNITKALQEHGLYNDTLFAFTTDNGGWVQWGGNNWPLRAGKLTIYEGGTRGVAFFSGKGIEKTGYVHNGLMHAVDWSPTLMAAAGKPFREIIDGVNQWDAIRTGGESPRTEFVYNIDEFQPLMCGHAAIRMGDYKLIDGTGGYYDGWFPEPEVGFSDEFVKSDLDLFQTNAIGNSTKRYRLFNIKDDPTEHFDLADKLPDVVKKLAARLAEYHQQMLPADYPPSDNAANPSHWGNVWASGWC
ncbi:arylsulfatase B-like [Liolophura sinensis]|uniref:arylsulfatase B-like n=1 Tax=Liolophura sinensis TaxID=3198878 RepID=UPI0031588FCB